MDPIALLLDTLRADGRLRVWSLVITVFGDSVQHRGGEINTTRLAKLFGRVGIEAGALRTALSRLRGDGWVDSRKNGRTSTYFLTKRGIDRFGPATDLIYRAPRQGPVENWVFKEFADAPAISIAGGFVYPAQDDTTIKGDGFQITGRVSETSRDLIAKAVTPAHEKALRVLQTDLATLGTLHLSDHDPITAAAARTLLVHRWRRVVLKFPELPPDCLPQKLDQTDMRGAVATAYARLSDAAEMWLDSETPDMKAMPAADSSFVRRFTN